MNDYGKAAAIHQIQAEAARERLEERAAILEYDAGLPRAEAERVARELERLPWEGEDFED